MSHQIEINLATYRHFKRLVPYDLSCSMSRLQSLKTDYFLHAESLDLRFFSTEKSVLIESPDCLAIAEFS